MGIRNGDRGNTHIWCDTRRDQTLQKQGHELREEIFRFSRADAACCNTLLFGPIVPRLHVIQRGAGVKKSTINLLVNKKTCTKDKAVIEKLVLQKTISIANLKSICPKRIKVGRNNVGIKIDDHAMQSPAGTLRVLWADNLENDLKPKKLCGDNNCTVSVSPLVIHVASNVKQPEPVELSAQEQGVMFDLFGKKGDGRKVRISWFTNPTSTEC